MQRILVFLSMFFTTLLFVFLEVVEINRELETRSQQEKGVIFASEFSEQVKLKSTAEESSSRCLWDVVRSPGNPVIKAGMPGFSDDQASNINGPSVIRVPEWLPNPLGQYYMYFAHHKGRFIRLAYADSIHGPWKIYEPGTLKIEQTVARNHIASPDVHVDEERKRIYMYFHGVHPTRSSQVTFVAFSQDGINFKSSKEVLGPFYFRVFFYGGWHYAIAKKRNESGIILRSPDGLRQFEEGPEIIPRIRHSAVFIEGGRLFLFYSRWGDNPESILMSEISLKGDWREWKPSEPVVVLKPDFDYEGAHLPSKPSLPGATVGPVCQLRDPCIFVEEGKLYLFYSIAGENGIALAELKPKD